MSNWSLYLVRCKNGSLYTGITTDVERRFLEHQANDKKTAKYLRGKGPLQLAFAEQVGNRSEASIAEAKVKKLSKIYKDKLITGSITLHSLLL
jgi:putative endonuclease